ncbi:MAG TPA: hypothetical protein VFP98_08795 [Candidatus Polarisedimenticolia bacterium]|nr:hypothetical protein [Candidatus Polarisedimenticolia bacterium]
MIRVFLLAMLALAALVLVARVLPRAAAIPQPVEQGFETAGPGRTGGFDAGTSPFAPWDGVWTGTLRSYEPDGTLVASSEVLQEHTSISPGRHKVDLVERREDGSSRRSSGDCLWEEGRLECRVQQADGTAHVLKGRRAGRAILWHRSDPSSGIVETFREEVISTSSGDLYTVDGVSVLGTTNPRVLVHEGRYRRGSRDSE